MKDNKFIRMNKSTVIRSRLVLIFGVIILFVILNILTRGKLFRISNLSIVCCHAVFPALVAWSMMFIYTTGNIDLSLGANMLFSGWIGIMAIDRLHLGYAGMILGAVICCILLQLLSLTVSEIGHLPAWIAGLGMTMLYEAILSIYVSVMSKTTGSASFMLPNGYDFFSSTVGMIILWIIGLFIAYIFFCKTSVGLYVRAIGGSELVAKAVGINKRKTVYIAATIAGVLLGLSAISYISYSGTLYAKSGLTSITIIFKALAAYLLADSVSSIVEIPIGIFFSSFAVELLFQFMSISGIPAGTGQNVGLGVIVILFGVISSIGKKKGVVK